MSIVEDAKKYALDEIEKYGTPFPTHFYLSEKKAMELVDKLGGNKTVVQVGVYFMDLKLGQASKEKRHQDHVAMSVDAANEFLKNYELAEEEKNKILNCIAAHHRDEPFECIEAEICANADCYRFIHPRGFFAYFNLLGTRTIDFDGNLDKVESKLEEKHNILSLDICKQELEPYYQTFKQYLKSAREL